jgi:hypothetical protein
MGTATSLTPTLVLLLAATLPAAQQPDPNDPGILDPVIETYLNLAWRLPSSHQVTFDSEQINIVGRVRKKKASQSTSMAGYPIQNTESPNRDLRNSLRDLSDAAAQQNAADMQASALALEAILMGTTQGSIYDGFAMLNFNRGNFTADQIPGEYKAKYLEHRGLMAPGLDGKIRPVWEVDATLFYYDDEMDSDVYFLVAPPQANPYDRLIINYSVYSTTTESFVPTTLLNNASPFSEGEVPSKGFDAVWIPLGGDELTELTVDHGTLENLRGIQLWGWRAKPHRSLFLQPVFESIDTHTGSVKRDAHASVMMERMRNLNLDSISPAAPERKILTVIDAVKSGAAAADVLAMLEQTTVQPYGTTDTWSHVLASKDRFPVEVLRLLAQEGIYPGQPGINRLGPYHAILVYANHEIYSTSLDLEGHDPATGAFLPLPSDAQGQELLIKVFNLDQTTHYLQTFDYGPALFDDIATCKNAPAGSHSLEIFVDQPLQGAPKMAEMHWRVGWGLHKGLGVLQQYDVYSRPQDQIGLTDFTDQMGNLLEGWQYPPVLRGADFRVNPPQSWLGNRALNGLSENGQAGLVIGTTTPGYGGARVPQGDLSAYHPDHLLNRDTDGDQILDALIFPNWLRNPGIGGDLIPTTPEWKPFLYLNPNNGTPWIDPGDPAQGWWVDRTFVFGQPLPEQSAQTISVIRTRAVGQALWHADGMYRENAATISRSDDDF